MLKRNHLIFFTLISSLILSCNSSDKIEIFSSQLITALAEMDSNELKILLYDDGNYNRAIRNVKREFIEKGLEGWPKIEAKGYILTDEEDGEEELMIFCTDGYGSYFEVHGIQMSKLGEDITFRLKGIDIDKTWPNKDALIEQVEALINQDPERPMKIIWFD